MCKATVSSLKRLFHAFVFRGGDFLTPPKQPASSSDLWHVLGPNKRADPRGNGKTAPSSPLPPSPPRCPLGAAVLPIAPVLYPTARRTSARVVSFRGRPPTDVTAKLWVTPLRTPRRPVSREARDGEQVEAAEWKSTNLGNKKTLRSQTPARSNAACPSLLPGIHPLLPRDEGLERGVKLMGMDGCAPRGTELWPPSLCTQNYVSEILSPAGPHGRETPFAA